MRNFRHASSRRGFALLLVLIIVSFAAGVAVLFLLSAKQERAGTDSYAQGSRVRQLADTAVNIVMGQVNAATREGTNSVPRSWASQPGMIRTYKQDGTLSNAYKLYSWNNMIEPGTFPFKPTDPTELPPNNWYTQTAFYTDLNAPVLTSNPSGNPASVLLYPIMDPTIFNTSSSVNSSATLNNTASPQIPWDFPNELAYIKDASLGYYTSAAANSNILPMPVQWLYVLQDGSWVYPTGGAGNTANFSATDVPADNSNPIVGRIAFWADDETCKVNINTAGEGAYWDWPKAASQDEVQFSGNPPVKNEFYRTSGHPGSTSLSAVFPEVMGSSVHGGAASQTGFARWNYGTFPATAFANANTVYIAGMKGVLGGDDSGGTYYSGLTPRYSYGTGTTTGFAQTLTGSRAGTYPTPYYQIYDPVSTPTSGTFSDGNVYASYSNYGPVPLFNYRLYATPDELFFSPQPDSTNGGRGNTASPPPSLRGYENPGLYRITDPVNNTQTPLTQYQLAQRGSLITTTSRSPETTLFNTPRVSMWPITWPYPNSNYASDSSSPGTTRTPANPSALTYAFVANSANIPTDAPNTANLTKLAGTRYYNTKWILPQEDLVAFCSTLNAMASGTSPSATNAPLPYYFQRRVADSPKADWTNITRNQYLSNYIRGMVHSGIPGLSPGASATLEAKWGASNADWIVLECMDYCRSQINQITYDPNSIKGTVFYSFTGQNIRNAAERNAYTVPPLRLTAADVTSLTGAAGGSNFNGSPLPNAVKAGKAAAYVTQGSFPSLKEVAMVFIATGRYLPVYRGEMTATGPKVPSTVGDPFYWANLINPGPGYGGIQGNSALAGAIPDGDYPTTGSKYTSTFKNGDVNTVGASYPIGCRTTSIQAFMVFDFTGLRDGINVDPYPNIWIRLDNADKMIINGTPFIPQSTVSSMYRGRSAFSSFDQVPNFAPGPAAGLTTTAYNQWGLCSNIISVDPNAVTFSFSSSPNLTASLYASYDVASHGGPNVDPTADANQFITSYDLKNFGGWPGALPMPIAPRWTSRQGPSVWYPELGEVANGKPTFFNAEMVPYITGIDSWTWSSAPSKTPPSFDVTDSNVRDQLYPKTYTLPYPDPTTGSFFSLDGLNTSGIELMMYASGYETGTLYGTNFTNFDPPARSGTQDPYYLAGNLNLVSSGPPGWSMSMDRRYGSLNYLKTGSAAGYPYLVAAENTPPKTLSPLVTIKKAPLFGSTTFIGNSGAGPTNGPQATQLVTPYDTVISVMIDPSDSGNPNRQGDQRLANNAGETASMDTSDHILKTYGSAPAMVLNGSTPLSVSNYGGINGKRAYPRPTFQYQNHQMNNHGYIGYLTGYHFAPAWTRAPLNNPRSNKTLFAMEGANGGSGQQGSNQGLFTGVGLDTNVYMMMNPDWDWTSQAGSAADGGYVERADQDYQNFFIDITTGIFLGTPYFSRQGIGINSSLSVAGVSTTSYANVSYTNNVSNFSISRQVPSPVQFGTLPEDMLNGWRTLCFSPNPSSVIDAGNLVTPVAAHPGPGVLRTTPDPVQPPYTTLPDHPLLDFFWVPVAEPYPISQQFSTAGKINLNYQMMPFPYIQRKTGLDAVLKSVWIYSIADTVTSSISTPQDYKAWYYMSDPLAPAGVNRSNKYADNTLMRTRFPINVDQTLSGFDVKFRAGDIFRSASQICDMFLYPNSPTTANSPVLTAESPASSLANIKAWWLAKGMLTSDNGREAPYNAIYSRITTQSNTYTVHWKVQALKKATNNTSVANTWVDGTDRVVSELRGSTLVERYLDPNAGATVASAIPDYANPNVYPNPNSATNPNPITYFYKWRVDNETYFQPGP